jgi:hypothetical protein
MSCAGRAGNFDETADQTYPSKSAETGSAPGQGDAEPEEVFSQARKNARTGNARGLLRQAGPSRAFGIEGAQRAGDVRNGTIRGSIDIKARRMLRRMSGGSH